MGVQINGDTGNVIATKGTFSGDVGIGGTLTYEDVTNIDAVGIITARNGIEIGARPGVGASISVDGNAIFSGLTTTGSLEVSTGFIKIPDSIIHVGDADTKIRFPDNDTISFETSGSEGLRINSDGYLGIGTASVNTPLHVHHSTVNGVALFESGDVYCNLVFQDSNSNDSGKPQFGVQGDDFRWATHDGSSSAERMRIKSSGELLINQATVNTYVDGAGYSQTPLLQVISNDNTSTMMSLRYNSGAGAATRRATFAFARTADGTAVADDSVLGEVLFMGEGDSALLKAASVRAEVDGAPGASDMPGRLIFSTVPDGSATLAERARITNDGRFLMGGLTANDATDTSKLAVQGGDSNIGIIQVHAGGGETTGDLAGICFSHGVDDSTSRPKAAIAFNRNASYGRGDLCFYVDETTDDNAVASGDERLRITKSGNIISNGGSTARIAWGTVSGVLYSGFSRYDGAAQDVGISHYATTNAGTSFVEHFRMEHNGTLKGTDTSIGSLSDIRLKKDIKDYSYDISKFKQFKPKSFNWINPEVHGDKSNVKGFIAQDIELVDKDWVEDSWIRNDDPDYDLVKETSTKNGLGEDVGISKISKFGYKDAMYISVIQQLISRIETLESS